MSISSAYYSANWETHIMGMNSGNGPFHIFEEEEAEIAAIEGSLDELKNLGLLKSKNYDGKTKRRWKVCV
ncbi:MAG: hypothetical protein F6K41_18340 [Symploca sp. SIO3E6]|nr:hypothetical protein [Caldora sp. SIO3E6]